MMLLLKHFKIPKLRLLSGICIILGLACFNTSRAITVTVGTAGTYSTLRAAFADINTSSNGMTGAITLNIISNITETVFPIVINSNTITATYTSVLIQPQGGSWTITGNANSYFIQFNAASDVTIDGLNTGGNALTLENVRVYGSSGCSTIGFIGGAHDILIRNCTIKGSVRRLGSAGAVIYFNTGSNHDITITNCYLTQSSVGTTPYNIIQSVLNNYNVTISNNNIYDYGNDGAVGSSDFSHGVHLNSPGPGTIGTGGTQSWVIDGNNFFQTAARSSSVGGGINGAIYVWNPSGTVFGIDITNNVIGHTATVGTMDMTYTYNGAATSVPYLIPIYVNNLNTGTTSYINGNTIAGISYTTTISGGGGTVGSGYWSSGNCPGIFTAIAVHDATGTSYNPTVYIGGTAANRAEGNVIGMAGYPISVSSSSNSGITMSGIWAAFVGTCYIQNNTVTNWRPGETGTGSITMNGIALGNSNPYAPTINGYCTGNQIYDLDMVSGTSGIISGIRQISSSSVGGWNVANNMISLTSTYAGLRFNGIYEANQNPPNPVNNYYYNSIYLGGTGSAGTSSSAMYFPCGGCGNVTNTITNNIFYMDRSGAGTSYCIDHSVFLPLTAPASWTSDYNIFINTQGTIVGKESGSSWTFAQWKTNTSNDANSYTGITPIFFNNTSTGDLHITWDMSATYPGTSLAASGVYPLGIDYDDPQVRNNPPDIGADEFGSLLPVELVAFAGTGNSKKVDLWWVTAMEMNCDYYQVERSTDGKQYEPIGIVKGGNNSSAERHYSFTDHELPATTDGIYYRLLQTDYDGKSEYFGPIKIKVRIEDDWNLILNNNQGEEVQAVIASPESGRFIITLTDLHGRTVYTTHLDAERGLNTLRINLDGFSTGMYFIHVSNSRKTLAGKVMRR